MATYRFQPRAGGRWPWPAGIQPLGPQRPALVLEPVRAGSGLARRRSACARRREKLASGNMSELAWPVGQMPAGVVQWQNVSFPS
jgi:hypothetical protein